MDKIIEPNYVPKQALIVYKQRENQEIYIETRRIEKSKKGFQMMEGIPLSNEAINDIVKYIKPKKKTKERKMKIDGLIPSNLLAFSNDDNINTVIWYSEPGPRDLIFKKELGIKDGVADIPALIFKYKSKTLSVFAIKDDEINSHTILYKAPFHNIYSDGKICMGNTKIRESLNVAQVMRNCEEAFFSSKFTHLQISGSPINSNLNTYLTKLIKTQCKFDLKKLKPQTKFKNLNSLL